MGALSGPRACARAQTTSRVLPWAAAALVLAASLLAPSAASAHGADPYSWRDCSYAYLEAAGKSILVSDTNDQARRFPKVTWDDGFRNSFFDRIGDAVEHWDHVMTDLIDLDAGMTYAGTGRPAHVRVSYEPLDDANAITTRTYRAGDSCEIHGTGQSQVQLTAVKINRRDDWFTQGASRRGYWEMCPKKGRASSPTCSRTRDFGSTITHELGHALGLHHPQEVDAEHPTSAAELATCANKRALATMCSVSYTYTTAKRTLDAYDVESLRRHYDHARSGR